MALKLFTTSNGISLAIDLADILSITDAGENISEIYTKNGDRIRVAAKTKDIFETLKGE